MASIDATIFVSLAILGLAGFTLLGGSFERAIEGRSETASGPFVGTNAMAGSASGELGASALGGSIEVEPPSANEASLKTRLGTEHAELSALRTSTAHRQRAEFELQFADASQFVDRRRDSEYAFAGQASLDGELALTGVDHDVDAGRNVGSEGSGWKRLSNWFDATIGVVPGALRSVRRTVSGFAQTMIERIRGWFGWESDEKRTQPSVAEDQIAQEKRAMRELRAQAQAEAEAAAQAQAEAEAAAQAQAEAEAAAQAQAEAEAAAQAQARAAIPQNAQAAFDMAVANVPFADAVTWSVGHDAAFGHYGAYCSAGAAPHYGCPAGAVMIDPQRIANSRCGGDLAACIPHIKAVAAHEMAHALTMNEWGNGSNPAVDQLFQAFADKHTGGVTQTSRTGHNTVTQLGAEEAIADAICHAWNACAAFSHYVQAPSEQMQVDALRIVDAALSDGVLSLP